MPLTIPFSSIEHRTRFLQVIQEIGKVYEAKIDPEYGSALYIFTSDVTVWKKVENYIARSGIDFAGIVDDIELSDEVMILVQVAWNLFNGGTHIDPLSLAELDERHLILVFPAIILRQREFVLNDL